MVPGLAALDLGAMQLRGPDLAALQPLQRLQLQLASLTLRSLACAVQTGRAGMARNSLQAAAQLQAPNIAVAAGATSGACATAVPCCGAAASAVAAARRPGTVRCARTGEPWRPCSHGHAIAGCLQGRICWRWRW